jgi:glycogenin glucosyltransferase
MTDEHQSGTACQSSARKPPKGGLRRSTRSRIREAPPEDSPALPTPRTPQWQAKAPAETLWSPWRDQIETGLGFETPKNSGKGDRRRGHRREQRTRPAADKRRVRWAASVRGKRPPLLSIAVSVAGWITLVIVAVLLLVRGQKWQQQQVLSLRATTRRYAYATLLCDDERMLRAVAALVHSLRVRANTSYPILVLTTPNLSTAASQHLEALGATVIRREPLPYPFALNAARLRDNKPCRYAKLHLWSLTTYEKIVFLDGDTLVLAPIDDLFEKYDALAAAPDLYPETFNSGVMVLEPRHAVYASMLARYRETPSYNLGDQGFLNSFFGEQWRANPKRFHLPLEYNTLLKLRETILWASLQRRVRVVHFTGETKPWSWHLTNFRDWDRHIDPVFYYEWIQIDRSARNLSLDEPHWARCALEAQTLAMHNGSLGQRFPLRDRYSVVLSTYSRDDLLHKLLRIHYRPGLFPGKPKSRQKEQTSDASALIDKVFIVWHDPQRTPPPDLLRNLPPDRFLLVQQQQDSLNNRFNPLGPALRTRAVLIVDDDIRIHHEDAAFAFRVWQDNPNALVGFFPRFHRRHPQTGTYEYHIAEPVDHDANASHRQFRRYSIVLTKHMFMRADFLFYYRCLLPDERIHAYVDEHRNCEDIACQCMVTSMGGSAPIAVRAVHPVEDYGTPGVGVAGGISASRSHLGSRSHCIATFLETFWKGSNALLYNDVIMERFVKIPFEKKRLRDLAKT